MYISCFPVSPLRPPPISLLLNSYLKRPGDEDSLPGSPWAPCPDAAQMLDIGLSRLFPVVLIYSICTSISRTRACCSELGFWHQSNGQTGLSRVRDTCQY